ncbi:hypothetical protein ILUMI_14661 [Ignelater luminosus]|uniref:Uncharacterized protein n=1 Tax=Ignelater luminosus TaxID=2038154 RepID=A0A8K0CUD3_IGNLU|nr:hypothetical protein ILUMI_14661 [Ignelater luminosus]
MATARGGIMFAGHLSEFDPANADWSVFQKRLENYFTANAIEDDKLKAVILLTNLNEDGYKLIYNLCLPIIPENKKYSKLTKIFREHFKPNLSVFTARYEFYQSKKRLNESTKEWAARIRSLAATCYFETTELEMVLRDHFIVGYDRGPVQDRLLEEKKTILLSDAIEIAAAKSALKSTDNTFIKKEPKLHFHKSKTDRRKPKSQEGTPAVQQVNKCTVCGRKNHLPSNCYYRNHACHICKKKGHLAPGCS